LVPFAPEYRNNRIPATYINGRSTWRGPPDRKEMLQHLPNKTVTEYIAVIAHRYRFALLTDAIEPVERANTDSDFGDWRPLRLDRPPFSARGAMIFNYFPQNDSHFWKNGVFLLLEAT